MRDDDEFPNWLAVVLAIAIAIFFGLLVRPAGSREGITEVWNITWYCVTKTNAECAAMDGKVNGVPPWTTPWKYFSEDQCVSFAEGYAEKWWNEDRFVVEYSCDHVQTYEPFVATRRYRKPETENRKIAPECDPDKECEYARGSRRRR